MMSRAKFRSRGHTCIVEPAHSGELKTIFLDSLVTRLFVCLFVCFQFVLSGLVRIYSY